MKPLNEWEESFLAKSIILALIIITVVSLLYFLRNFYHDDAYIALRYARNFLSGNGLVWNPGERVEGYTSLLWILLILPLVKAGVNIVFASRLIGVVSLIGICVILISMKKAKGWYASLLIVSNGAVIAWSIGGLETLGFALTITACLLYGERLLEVGHPLEYFLLGLTFGLAELCRPEAVLFFVVVAFWFMVFRVLRENPSWKSIVLFFLGFFVIVISHLSWRLSYYGEWLPNTFYVKAGFNIDNFPFGIKYLLQFCLFQCLPLLVLAIGMALQKDRLLSKKNWFFLSSIIIYVFYIVYVGGDHMQWFRFFVPVLPILYFLTVREILRFAETSTRKWIFPMAILILFLTNVITTGVIGTVMKWKEKDPAAYHGKLVGKYIAGKWPKNSVVALNTAGSTAFYSGLRCIDMLGLNDKHIARVKPTKLLLFWANLPGHRKGDGLYVLARKPDYIIIGASEGYSGAWFVSDKEIIESEEFKTNYHLYKVWISQQDGNNGFWFKYYKREEGV